MINYWQVEVYGGGRLWKLDTMQGWREKYIRSMVHSSCFSSSLTNRIHWIDKQTSWLPGVAGVPYYASPSLLPSFLPPSLPPSLHPFLPPSLPPSLPSIPSSLPPSLQIVLLLVKSPYDLRLYKYLSYVFQIVFALE